MWKRIHLIIFATVCTLIREILRIRDESEIIKQPLHILLYPVFEHILLYLTFHVTLRSSTLILRLFSKANPQNHDFE